MQKGIRDLRQLVHNTLTHGAARRVEEIPDREDTIYLKHRVFTKVLKSQSIINCLTSVLFQVQANRDRFDSMLSPADDPECWVPRVSDSWQVIDKIAFGRTLPDGKIVSCNHLIFTPGDFVDASVTMDVTYRSRGHGLSVHLSLKQLVQVMAGALEDSVRMTIVTQNTGQILIDINDSRPCHPTNKKIYCMSISPGR